MPHPVSSVYLSVYKATFVSWSSRFEPTSEARVALNASIKALFVSLFLLMGWIFLTFYCLDLFNNFKQRT